ncbi:MAG: uroporphyrinogen-III synthase [Candidatus Omnitrophica bacterium]|nr:uroporphyrinogen-III synthase [Candidatus Omnitrophota bacterium]
MKQRKKKNNGPLRGKAVLVTRPGSQSGSMKKMLEKMGARVFNLPVIQIVEPEDWGPFDEALKQIKRYHWMILTSVNGVRGVLQRLHALGRDLHYLDHVRIAAIGEATAFALTESGRRPDLVPGQFTSEGLLEAFREKDWVRGRNFLLPRADIAPGYLAEELERHGGCVTQVTAYRTVFPKPTRTSLNKLETLLKERKIDYITLTSASTVSGFFDLLPGRFKKKVPSRFVTIGPVTSEALRRYGHEPYREAKTHTVNGLIKALTASPTA